MNKKCEMYVNMVKLVNDIYKENKDYEKTLKIIKKYDNELMKEWIIILKYIQKLYISYDKKIKNIKDYTDYIIIKTGIEYSYKKLIDIYIYVYKDYNIDIEIMLSIIIPSIIITTKNGFEIIDSKIGSELNNNILKMIINDNIKNDSCSICFENLKKIFIISNCCCYKTCLRCFELLSGNCAICKNINPIIIRILK